MTYLAWAKQQNAAYWGHSWCWKVFASVAVKTTCVLNNRVRTSLISTIKCKMQGISRTFPAFVTCQPTIGDSKSHHFIAWCFRLHSLVGAWREVQPFEIYIHRDCKAELTKLFASFGNIWLFEESPERSNLTSLWLQPEEKSAQCDFTKVCCAVKQKISFWFLDYFWKWHSLSF